MREGQRAQATAAPFETAFPGGVLLDPGDREGAGAVLAQAGIDAPVNEVERAGEGNMNLVLRVRTPDGSLIIKQARPWVEKYPQIAAPPERCAVEAAFYGAVAGDEVVAERMPRLVGRALESGALVLEDLGRVEELSGRYAGAALSQSEVETILEYLGRLHRLSPDDDTLHNRSMRALNHQHIFEIPLDAEAGPDLDAITPGLSQEASALRNDAAFVRECVALGERYLADGPHLLHGDIHPGSVLQTEHGLRIIDPEFAFLGPVEFDLGVLLAHLILMGYTRDEAVGLIGMYGGEGGAVFDAGLTQRFAGVEIMRRLLGVAQLALPATLATKAHWLRLSRDMVLAAA